jgi:hypothetical protein
VLFTATACELLRIACGLGGKTGGISASWNGLWESLWIVDEAGSPFRSEAGAGQIPPRKKFAKASRTRFREGFFSTENRLVSSAWARI